MANVYELMNGSQLAFAIRTLEEEAREVKAKGLSLDMARGKPNPEQTALARPMLDLLTSGTELVDGASLVDNYGDPWGLPSARALAAELLGVDAANVIVCGSSSLNLMYSLVCNGYTRGIAGQTPWCKQDEVKFLCPAPGYDRHFTVTQSLGIKNVMIPLGENGPDPEQVRALVESDPCIKGIWCVPKYANPTGITYSDEVVRSLASLKPAAPDFRIYWDNAYIVHDLYDEGDELLNIFDACREAGTGNLVYEFASTAKVTFPSSGMAFVAADADDMAEIRAAFSAMRVSPEKVSQLAHVLFLHDAAGVRAHMAKHAAIVRPRFELVDAKLQAGLGELDVATWTHPRGGYFVSFNGPKGSAKAIVAMCKELGVTLTGAGATYPYGKDPCDSNIRIAPTYPSLEELGAALDVLVLATKLVAARLALAKRGRQPLAK